MSLQLLAVRLPALTPFACAWALQRAVHAEVAAGERPDTLLLLEHPRTITMGRRGGWTHLSTSPARLHEEGFELWHIDRGGDITYHGPGQLVGYPIVNLRRADLPLGDFVRGLEQAHIATLAELGVAADVAPGFTGVWCGRHKITAIGVRVSAWTTLHGFALNVATALQDFDHIVPCGLEGRGVTSLAQRLDRAVAVDDLVPAIARHLAATLRLELAWADPTQLPTPPAGLAEALRAEHLLPHDGAHSPTAPPAPQLCPDTSHEVSCEAAPSCQGTLP